MFCSQDTSWKGLNSEHFLSGRVGFLGPVAAWGQPGCSVLLACSVFRKLAFGDQIQLPWWCRVLCVHLSLPQCPDMWKGWSPVLKCGVVTSPPLQPLLSPGCHRELCQHVMLPTAVYHVLGANSRQKELPQFVLFILAGFSLNIQVNQVLARLFLQLQCEEPRALGQPIRR